MIISMTGFGKAVTQASNKKITVEIRTLNSKSLDVNVRVPSVFREKELELRQLVSSHLHRGKIDFNLHVEGSDTDTSVSLNLNSLESYIQQLKKINGIQLTSKDDATLLEIASRLPEVYSNIKEEIDPEIYKQILGTVQECLSQVNSFRATEGAVLEKDFAMRVERISDLLEEIMEEDKVRLASIRTRLEKAVTEVKETVDENRFEQELIYYLEKYDITEEKVRLSNHLSYFTETMNEESVSGKKLGFISQEIGREINTIGSKSNHAPMQQLVVQMKDELEKIKEQLLNVL